MLIVAASTAFLLSRRVAVTFFLACTFLGVLALVVVKEWGVSFLDPVIPGLLCGWAYRLRRRGLLC